MDDQAPAPEGQLARGAPEVLATEVVEDLPDGCSCPGPLHQGPHHSKTSSPFRAGRVRVAKPARTRGPVADRLHGGPNPEASGTGPRPIAADPVVLAR